MDTEICKSPMLEDERSSSDAKDVRYYTNMLMASGLMTVAIRYSHEMTKHKKTIPKE